MSRLDDLRTMSVEELRKRYADGDEELPRGGLTALRQDPRSGARAVAERILRRIYAAQAEGRRLTRLCAFEQPLWEQGLTLVAGVDFNFSQAIADNVEEAMSGVKGENTTKVVGPDLRLNEEKAHEIARVLSGVRGVEDLGVFRTLGQPDVRIVPDREALGRYGLNVGDVMNMVQAAIGGVAVTQVYEGEKHFDLVVRWAAPYRSSLQAIRAILVPTPAGAQVPLGLGHSALPPLKDGCSIPRCRRSKRGG